MIKVVITAAGKGTRLLPFTKEMPKEMMPIFSSTYTKKKVVLPLLQYIYEQLYSMNFRDYCFVVGREKRSIEDHFTPHETYLKELTGDYKKFITKFYQKLDNSHLVWINQNKPLGFGDAIKRTERYVGKEDFIVHAGDVTILSKSKHPILRLIETANRNSDAKAILLCKEIKDFKTSSARANLISDSLPSGILLLGRDGKIIYSNEAVSQIVGSDIALFETIEDWLAHALVANDQLGVNELLERWRSLVWIKGAVEIFSINTDLQEPLEIEFRPKLMKDGSLLMSISEVADTRVSGQIIRDNRTSVSEMNGRMDTLLSIVSEILQLWGNDQDSKTLNVTVSRIDTLALLLAHTTKDESHSSVNFGKYISSLVKELIELAPDHSDPCVHLNYGIQHTNQAH